MTAFENAKKFIEACDGNLGWEGCKSYVVDGAPFVAQAQALAEVETVEAYCEWMKGLGEGPLKGCVYEINGSAYDEANKMAIYYATITGTHVGDGGPVPPTNKQTKTDYVCALTMNDEGKVAKMEKVWNDVWALKELGWA